MVQNYSSEVILKCILNFKSSLSGMGIFFGKVMSHCIRILVKEIGGLDI